MNAFCETIRALVAAESPGPLLAHCDVFGSRAALAGEHKRTDLLSGHILSLEYIAQDCTLLLPTFNYDYLRSGHYRPATDASQVGPLTEHARLHWATYRVGPPVFNFVGRAPFPIQQKPEQVVDPFGSHSIFAELHRARGLVLLYGTTLAALTMIHYIERLSGGPLYRYDKYFAGTIDDNHGPRPVTLLYHCRPLGRHLDYDFPRLVNDAERAGAVSRVLRSGSEVGVVRCDLLCAFWAERLKADPLYLLDQASLQWVRPALNRLGRRFQQSDFEL